MEESILKADIFFFVATICLIIITILFSVVLFYGIKIARDVKELAKKAREEGEHILQDAKEMREDIKSATERLFSLISGWFLVKKKRPSKKKVSYDE